MFDITFNPGPSQLSPETKSDIQNAVEQNILSISHRSQAFSDLSSHTIDQLRQYFKVPKDYQIFYLSSATEAWHSITSNVVEQTSYHFINGAFSQKCAKAAQALGKEVLIDEVAWGEANKLSQADIPQSTELINVCANETSTGIWIHPETIKSLRAKYPQTLIAVDLTSIAGAIEYPIDQADIWYFSVQKALGLPPGLGILIVSPQAFERSSQLKKEKKNQAAMFTWEDLSKPMQKYQTPQTPNILNIYLLGQQLKRWNTQGGMKIIEKQTWEKMKYLETLIGEHPDLDFYVEPKEDRSPTVLTVKVPADLQSKIHQKAFIQNIVLGKGYGKIKNETFRIANFPNLTMKNMQKLSFHTSVLK